MSSHIVDSILSQIDQCANPSEIKKLLFMKLETLIGQDRGECRWVFEKPKDAEEVINLES